MCFTLPLSATESGKENIYAQTMCVFCYHLGRGRLYFQVPLFKGGAKLRRNVPLRQIGVIGAGNAKEEITLLAYAVGAEIARAGAVLVCGGLGGVMEAAARGARKAGGHTVGILPGPDRSAANSSIEITIPTDMGHARNAVVVHASDALIAVGGAYGTLSEIALALKMGKIVVGLQSWEIPGILVVQDAPEALRVVLSQLTA